MFFQFVPASVASLHAVVKDDRHGG